MGSALGRRQAAERREARRARRASLNSKKGPKEEDDVASSPRDVDDVASSPRDVDAFVWTRLPFCLGVSVLRLPGRTSAPCAPLSAPRSLRPAQCALRPAHCALRPAHCALRPAHCALRPAQCAPLSAPCAPLSVPLSAQVALLNRGIQSNVTTRGDPLARLIRKKTATQLAPTLSCLLDRWDPMGLSRNQQLGTIRGEMV
ncbi:hypothetical protein EYF80_045652 [Liparis tanakae]|uniref:Uncharacterized protein n=1 Tax=Liparis tanakae TaxID=230148 RepID=A0A4Z2FTN3_9TELE|nr:hypothetical protein EYF80_045652 [Liparis tanakae]